MAIYNQNIQNNNNRLLEINKTINNLPGQKFEENKNITITTNGTIDVLPNKGNTLSKVSITTNVPTGGTEEKQLLEQIVRGTVQEYTHPYEDMVYYLLARQDNLVKATFPIAKFLSPYALYRCPNLTTVEAPNVTEIDYEVFSRSTNIQSLIFPKCGYIGSFCFDRCTALTYVEIGGIPYRLDDNIFNESGVTAFVIRSKTVFPLTNPDTFTGSLIASESGYIYVPKALLESYKTATNWVTYAAQIRAIEDFPEITGG